MISLKKCTKCKAVKDQKSFGKNRSTSDGFQAHCKECRSLTYQDNKIALNKYTTAYMRKNRKATNERNRKLQKMAVALLLDRYVRLKLISDGVKKEDINPDLISQKRKEIKLKRNQQPPEVECGSGFLPQKPYQIVRNGKRIWVSPPPIEVNKKHGNKVGSPKPARKVIKDTPYLQGI